MGMMEGFVGSPGMEATMLDLESDDLETPGYFMPEDSRLRLEKLREHMAFLSRLARQRTADEGQECGADVRGSGLATCLELLAEQAGTVLDAVSWPALRYERTAVPEPEAALGVAGEAPCDADVRLRFGVSLAQVDKLHQLIAMLSAHGDVVTASREAEFADHTLPLLGQAIFEGAQAVREIVRQVETQRLRPASGRRIGVGEDCAAYGAGLARQVPDSQVASSAQLTARIPSEHAVASGSRLLH